VESLDEYLTRLASEEPVPGGGSAATIVAAMGAALVAMVARICAANPKYAEHAGDARQIVVESDDVRTRLSNAREHDERAFAEVVAAQHLPKNTPEEKSARREALEKALRAAAEAPLSAAALALDALRLADRVLLIPNRSLASDAGCAAEFAAAALAACAYNVRVNHRYMHDEGAIAEQSARLAGYERAAETLLNQVRVKAG
jgi:formiminotetrahydrofolate cyclodeaminase